MRSPAVPSLTTPLSASDVADLRAGDRVRLSGVLFTARDAAHQRLAALIAAGRPLPIDMAGQVLYYVGPTPPGPGRIIGSAGPTTSGRMDRYAPALMALGLRGMIGKGVRSTAVRRAIRTHGCVYFGAVGGAGAILSKHIRNAEVVAYPELGTEAIRRLGVENFPVVVVNDTLGGDLYETGRQSYARAG